MAKETKAKTKAKKFIKPETKSVAIHDEDGVITGYEDAPLDDPRVAIPARDLAPGRYRWNADDGAYVAIITPAEGEQTTPSALAAIAKGFVYLANNGTALPLETLKWAAGYLGTTDGQGAIDGAADFDGGSE